MFERGERVYISQELLGFHATVSDVFEESKKLLVMVEDGKTVVIDFDKAKKIDDYERLIDLKELNKKQIKE